MQIIPSIVSWEHHPIDRLYRAGVPLNVNTGARILTPATLTGEYERLCRIFGWGVEELLRTNQMAVDAAFADEAMKTRLRKKFAAACGMITPVA